MSLTSIRKGGTKKIKLIVKSNGEVMDLSGDVVNFVLKSSETSATALIDSNLDISTQGSEGIAKLTISSTATAALSVGKKYYKFVVTRSNGEVYVLSAGNIYVISIYPT